MNRDQIIELIEWTKREQEALVNTMSVCDENWPKHVFAAELLGDLLSEINK